MIVQFDFKLFDENMSEYYKIALNIMNAKSPDVESVILNLTKAIEQGDGNAMYALGTWYLHGINGTDEGTRTPDRC